MLTIAELRAKNNKMSQKELAEALGTTQTSVSNWEKNQQSMNGSNLTKVAKFFKVSTDALLGLDKDE